MLGETRTACASHSGAGSPILYSPESVPITPLSSYPKDSLFAGQFSRPRGPRCGCPSLGACGSSGFISQVFPKTGASGATLRGEHLFCRCPI